MVSVKNSSCEQSVRTSPKVEFYDPTVEPRVFCPGALRPATDRYVRRSGWPSLEWVTELRKDAIRIAQSMKDFEAAAASAPMWHDMVKKCLDNYNDI